MENLGSRPAGSEPKPAAWIIPLARVSGRERTLVGGKAANLGQMLQAGLPVPDGFCVTTAAFRLWIEGNREAGALLDHLEALLPEGASELRDAAARLRQSLLGRPIPPVVREAICYAAAQAGTAAEAGATEGRSGASAYAVRSSATAEDLAEDVFFLQLEELGPVLLGRPPFAVASGVAARKAEYARQKLLSPLPVIVGDWEPVASEGSRPAGFEGPPGPDASQAAGARTRSLQGLPVSPGRVTGKARVILQADIGERLQPGEILVAPYTDPGWTPRFLAAAGIVVDLGGLLSHGSVVAREYGLPAVVNVGPATRLIRTGQLLEVDGNRGMVTVLE